MNAILLLVALALPRAAHAFPEMVRHGYNTCITCHVSPTGGGVLSEYGRELSREILSFRSSEKENEFAYGLVSLPEGLAAGGDIRTLQTYQDTPRTRSARFFLMQADLEAAYTSGRWTADATIGWDQRGETVFSRRHYLMYRPKDELLFRAGKYPFGYGLMIPDHRTSIRSGLGWDQGTETYNLEGSWIGESATIHATGIFGRPDDDTLNRETGGALGASMPLGDTYKVGLSGFAGSNDTGNRVVTGPFGILGFSTQLVLMSELDFQFASPNASRSTTGTAVFNRLSYEFFQGFLTFLRQEYLRTDFRNSLTTYEAYSVGVQFFPRPHWELFLQFQQQRPAGATYFIDYAFFMAHFYL
jgi:hypothetical protein